MPIAVSRLTIVRSLICVVIVLTVAPIALARPVDAPVNDDLANALAIETLPFADVLDTTDATDEPDEVPASCGSPGEPEAGVWYRLTADEDGTVAADTEGSSAGGDALDTVLSVWVGGPGHPLTEIACNDDGTPVDLWSRLVFEASAGQTYYIKAAGLAGATGQMVLTVDRAPDGPANDDLADAIDVTPLPFSDTRNTTYATDEADEVHSACADDEATERGVWYRMVFASTGSILLDTEGSSVDIGSGVLDEMDTVLSVWLDGAEHPLTELTCSDDVGDSLWSRVELEAPAGTTYYVKVGGLFGETGNVVLNARNTPPPPPNDDLAESIDAAPLPFTDGQDTFKATDEPGEVRASCTPDGAEERGVWYGYAPTTSHALLLDTAGSDYDTVLSVWRGGATHPLTEIACSDEGDLGGAAQLVVDVTAGQTYAVKVGAAAGNGGAMVLRTSELPPAPRNDDLGDASAITALPYTDWQDTRAATDEGDEVFASCGDPAGPDHGVWYRFDAPESGAVSFTTQGSDYDTVLSAWRGGPGHPLTEIACNDDTGGQWSELTLDTTAGETYYIKAGGHAGDRGILVFGSTLWFVYLPMSVR